MANMLLILEGADCSGKTTFANNTIDFFGKENCEYMHSTYFSGMDVLSHHKQVLTKAIYSLTKKAVVIVDRHWISECVYGSEYRKGCSYAPAENQFYKKINDLGGQYVLCIPDKETQVLRHKERKASDGEMFSDINGVIDRYSALWHGKTLDYMPQNYVDFLTQSGGVHKLMNWHLYDWQKHGDILPEFLKNIEEQR